MEAAVLQGWGGDDKGIAKLGFRGSAYMFITGWNREKDVLLLFVMNRIPSNNQDILYHNNPNVYCVKVLFRKISAWARIQDVLGFKAKILIIIKTSLTLPITVAQIKLL